MKMWLLLFVLSTFTVISVQTEIHGGNTANLTEINAAFFEKLQGDDFEQLKNDTINEIWDTTIRNNVVYPKLWQNSVKESISEFQEIFIKRTLDFQQQNCESGQNGDRTSALLSFLHGSVIEKLKNITVDKIWNRTEEINVFYKKDWTTFVDYHISYFHQTLVDMTNEFLQENCITNTTPINCYTKLEQHSAIQLHYDVVTRKCLLLIETPITAPEHIRRQYSCPQNSAMFAYDDFGVCVCDIGFMPSFNRTGCFRGQMRGDVCNIKTNPCDHFTGLTCSNGRCICNGNWFDSLCHSEQACGQRRQKFNPTTGRCQVKVQSPCNETSDCPQHAVCTNSEFHWNECQCQPEFRETPDKECVPNKSFGQACRVNRDGYECSQADGLECNNSVCACRVGSRWEPRENSCRRRHGSDCKTDSYKKNSESCEWNSECKNGICVCKSGYMADSTRRCFGDHMAKCSISGDCRSGFTCYDNVCKCPKLTSQTYAYGKDSLQRACVGNIGAHCNLWEQCSLEYTCIQNTCQCENGSSPTVGGKCRKSYGSACESKNCNHDEGLACVDGYCTCVDPDLQFGKGKGCIAKSGGICGVVDKAGSCPTDMRFGCGLESYHVGCQEPAICTELSKTVSRCI